jgi:alkylation response protein AidB-like acyl-CoA dehydrogenase
MMRFALDPGQQDLRDATAAVLRAECSTDDVRAAWHDPLGYSTARWGRLAELGLTSVMVPAAWGGMGATDVELVPLLEEAGYVALPEPVADAALAATILTELAPAAAARWLPLLADGSIAIAVGLDGSPYVASAPGAAVLLIARGATLHAVAPDDVELLAQPSVDGSRRLFSVSFGAGEPLTRDGEGLRRAADHGALYAAAQLLGLGRRCLDLSVAYACERHQFGRPIGSYQALKHRMADDWTSLEFARPLVWRAAWSVWRRAPDASLHVAAAKATAGDAATRSARTALQVHGATGYTFACDVHLFLKRIHALSTVYGDAHTHRRNIARVLRARDISRLP